MVIAAPRKVYLVTYTVEDEDQDQETSEYDWGLFWEETVRHVRESIHLPK